MIAFTLGHFFCILCVGTLSGPMMLGSLLANPTETISYVTSRTDSHHAETFGLDS